MKLTMKADDLSAALKRLKGSVTTKATIPILSHVLLKSGGERGLTLRGTDLDIEVIVEAMASTGLEHGEVCVPFGTLETFVGKLPKGADIALDAGGGKIKIVSGKIRASLQTLSASDFPTIDVGELSHTFIMEAKDLGALLARAQFAISSEETRYYLNGVFLHAHEGKLRAVATDGHRLARIDKDLPDGAAGMPGIIVPRKTVAQMITLCTADPGAQVAVGLSRVKVTFEIGTTKVLSKLIDGTFPDYQRVIPIGNNKIGVLNRKDLTQMVDRVSTISSERGRAIKLTFDTGKLVANVTNPDAGSATEDMEADFDSGDLDIGFNSRYLLDILAEVTGDKVRIELNDAGSPTILRSADDESFLCVLMPMRV